MFIVSHFLKSISIVIFTILLVKMDRLKFCIIFTVVIVFSAVEALSKEVLINTETAITCKITDITDKISVEWSGFQEGENYVTSPGSYDSNSNSQSGTLTVKSAAVTSDKTYTCTVSSIQHIDSAEKALDVHLNVYSKRS